MSWEDYKKITIIIPRNSVEETLVDFPLMLNLSNESGLTKTDLSEIFTELPSAAYRFKIAVLDDQNNQLYVEISSWRPQFKKAILWVKIPVIDPSYETILYLYYGAEMPPNTEYVGDVGSTAGQNVWPAFYDIVLHTNQRTCNNGVITESTTTSGNHICTGGNFYTSNLTSGYLDNAIRFNGLDNVLESPYYWNEVPFNNFVIEVFCKAEATHEIDTQSSTNTTGITGQRYLLAPMGSNSATEVCLGISLGTNGVTVYEHGASHLAPVAVYAQTLGTDFHYICIRYNDKIPYIYVDGDLVYTGPSSVKTNVYRPTDIGGIDYGYFCGILYEARFTNSLISEAWINLNSKTLFDQVVIYKTKDSDVGWLKTYENGTLSPWENRIKIEIDHSKIDETLIDFPVLLNISEESGITSKNIINIIDAFNVVYIDEFENFSLNTTSWSMSTTHFINNNEIQLVFGQKTELVWTIPVGNNLNISNYFVIDGAIKYTVNMVGQVEGSNYDHLYIYDSAGSVLKDYMGFNGTDTFIATTNFIRAKFTSDGSNFFPVTLTVSAQVSFIRFNYPIKGNFEVQVDFRDASVNNGTIYNMSLGVYSYEDNKIFASIGTGFYTSPVFWAKSNTIDDIKIDRLYNNSGSFKIVRMGSLLNLYYKYTNETLWTKVCDLTINSEDIYIKLHAFKEDDNFIPLVFFSNFVVRSYSGSKIAITTEDGITQLPIEIENLNITSLQMWTKLPLVKPNEITTLYLYYDVDKSDNTEYIGEIGTEISKKVWSNNYVSVHHLSQINSSTSNFKDSVATYNSINTSLVNMPYTIDGRTGMNFDGANSYIDIGKNMNVVGPYTYEVLANPRTLGENSYGRMIDCNEFNLYLSSTSAINTLRLSMAASTTGLFESTPGLVLYDTAQYFSCTWEVINATTMAYRNVHFFKNDTILPTTTITAPAGSSGVCTNTIIGNRAVFDRGFDGIIFEVRISNTIRSDGWLKASYHSIMDELLSYNEVETYVETPTQYYAYEGYVKNKATPVERKVLLYERTTGLLMDATTSDNQGHYLLQTPYNTEHFIVVLDNIADYKFNPLIQDRILPNGS